MNNEKIVIAAGFGVIGYFLGAAYTNYRLSFPDDYDIPSDTVLTKTVTLSDDKYSGLYKLCSRLRCHQNTSRVNPQTNYLVHLAQQEISVPPPVQPVNLVQSTSANRCIGHSEPIVLPVDTQVNVSSSAQNADAPSESTNGTLLSSSDNAIMLLAAMK